MLFKVALRNIRRSVKDYAIYFVTLLIAIMVFYAFNSVSDQQVMQDIANSNKANIVEFTGVMMGIFSTVVALVLGFLVIYANQLLIRRRKREFGMYFTLGMTAGHVSRIILYETVMVGIVSLVLGLVLGILASQLLSFATAALFGIPMPDYEFTFSMHAFAMTLVCFVAIYVVVAIFNVFSIRRCKLIDLLNADSKSQKVAIRNPWICLALFIVSLGMLGVAYWQLQQNGMTLMFDDHFNAATVLMLVGTLLLFFSFSGFIIAIITKIRGLYLKKLRSFTTRQVASKVNTSFASMWVVSVLLFFAITTFATGMALVDAFVKDIDKANPYDASIISYQVVANDEDFDITQTEAYLQEHFEGWDDLVQDAVPLTAYDIPTITYGDVMAATGTEVTGSGGSVDSQNVVAVKLSQLNEALALQGKQPVSLSDGEYLVTNNMAASEDLADEMAKQGFAIETPIGTLVPQKQVLGVQLSDYSVLSNGVTLVLPDEAIEEMGIDSDQVLSYLNIMFKPDADTSIAFEERIEEAQTPGVTSALMREDMISQAMGLRMTITYLALYIGLVLLVAVAAVLAIQLLSLTIDSLSRYRTLSRLGCDMRMLGRSLFAQVALYFLLPLAVAVCHSGWTIHLLADSFFEALGLDILPTILLSAGLVLLVYGGYMLITFFASRATVKAGLKARS